MAVVNQAFVRRFAGGQNVIGQHVTSVVPGGLNALIVGVVNDSVYRTVRLGVVPTMYLAMSQGRFRGSAFSVTAKLTSPRAQVERNIADAIGRAAPDLAFAFRDYGDQLRATVIQERLVALMSGFFGALAMLLAALGVYGVTAYAVGRRRAEIAVRMALGASPGDVVRLVLGRVAALILAGAAIGVAVSLWAARFVGPLLFGVERSRSDDPRRSGRRTGLGRIVCGMAPGSPGVTSRSYDRTEDLNGARTRASSNSLENFQSHIALRCPQSAQAAGSDRR